LDQLDLLLDVGLGEPAGEVEEGEAAGGGGRGEIGRGVEEGGQEGMVEVR
jgi:hypothetical protein